MALPPILGGGGCARTAASSPNQPGRFFSYAPELQHAPIAWAQSTPLPLAADPPFPHMGDMPPLIGAFSPLFLGGVSLHCWGVPTPIPCPAQGQRPLPLPAGGEPRAEWGRGSPPSKLQIGAAPAYAQWLVTTRLLGHVHDRAARLSRLQRIYPRVLPHCHPPARRAPEDPGARPVPAC